MANQQDILRLEQKINELEKEKSQLLKLISHDVKSPFNKLFALNNLLLMVSDNLNEEQLDYLNRMEWVIKEGLTVVRNLMDLRTIENKNVELHLEECSLDMLLTDGIRNYTKQLKAKKITISSNSVKVTIRSDKRVLERIFDNLISNGVKFSPKKSEIKVNLSTNNKFINLEIITQSGPIPLDEVASLFSRSSPLSTRPTHGESALGNGLFIAQNFAHKLSGKILFSQKESEISFMLKLPLKPF